MPDSVRPHRWQPTRLPVPGILQARTLEWAAISFSNAWKWKVKVKLLSRVWLLATPWTAAHQAPLSIGFSRQEYWSGVPLPSPTSKPRSYEIYCFSLFLLYSCQSSWKRHVPGIRMKQTWNRPEAAPLRWPVNQEARELNVTLNHWDSEVVCFIEKQTNAQRLPGNIAHGWESTFNSGKQSISFHPSTTVRWRWCNFWLFSALMEMTAAHMQKLQIKKQK